MPQAHHTDETLYARAQPEVIGWAFLLAVDDAALLILMFPICSHSLASMVEAGMSYLEAALIVLALGVAIPAVGHTLLDVRRSLRASRRWQMI